MYEPVVVEHDVVLDDIRGALPTSLVGTLYRNGPARWEDGTGFRAQHVFDGDGMVAQFTFAGGRVRYRNRFVRTPKFLAAADGKTRRGLGTPRPGGVLANAFRRPADRANTHAVFHAESLWALSDDGRPWEIDPDDLGTRGRSDFGGMLPARSRFSPHPRVDPRTGEFFNFGLAPDPRRPGFSMALQCYSLDAHGRMHIVNRAPLDQVRINHDFAITERYLVFVLAPVALDFAKAARAALGLMSYEAAVVYRPSLATRIVLVPRDGGAPRVVAYDAFPYVHLDNAYEDGRDVVVHLIRLPDWDDTVAKLRDFRHIDAANSVGGRLTRLRITGAGRVVEETLCELPGEFPQHDVRRTGRPYRYSYYTAATETPGIMQVVKVDHVTGDQFGHAFPMHDVPGEPLFVPRACDSEEDDGFLLCLAYHATEHRSALHVLSARRVEAPALAVARLPHHQFPGFHGSFTTRVARSSAR